MSDTTILKFTGGGHLPGVPARDLTQTDWDGLSPAEQAAALNCGLYEASSKKRAEELAQAVQASQAQAEAAPVEEVGG